MTPLGKFTNLHLWCELPLFVTPLGKFTNLHLRCELLLFVTPLGKFTNLHLLCELPLCDPAGAQTQNLQNRNLTLYSIELRGHACIRTRTTARLALV